MSEENWSLGGGYVGINMYIYMCVYRHTFYPSPSSGLLRALKGLPYLYPGTCMSATVVSRIGLALPHRTDLGHIIRCFLSSRSNEGNQMHGIPQREEFSAGSQTLMSALTDFKLYPLHHQPGRNDFGEGDRDP